VEEGKALAAKENMFFIETSAKDSTNIEKAFVLLSKGKTACPIQIDGVLSKRFFCRDNSGLHTTKWRRRKEKRHTSIWGRYTRSQPTRKREGPIQPSLQQLLRTE